MLFQKRVVRTKFNIHVFIKAYIFPINHVSADELTIIGLIVHCRGIYRSSYSNMILNVIF